MKQKVTDMIRRVSIPIFARLNPGDFTVKHAFTGQRLYLHSFRHKNYWFHGKNREKGSMELFRELVHPGDIVLDVGANIGYVSLYFGTLVGDRGRVYAFEPGQNNLSYLARNVAQARNITIIPNALGERAETRPFHLENLTGQTNSFLSEFKTLEAAARSHFMTVETKSVPVQVLRGDDFVEKNGIRPDFVKMDVEGFEYEVLKGLEKTICESRPAMMVELQVHYEEIFEMLTSLGYSVFRADRTRVPDATGLYIGGPNFFFIDAQDKTRLTPFAASRQ
jgi:FkbM family methyltransferase